MVKETAWLMLVTHLHLFNLVIWGLLTKKNLGDFILIRKIPRSFNYWWFDFFIEKVSFRNTKLASKREDFMINYSKNSISKTVIYF